jgi:CBS domain-containing protein
MAAERESMQTETADEAYFDRERQPRRAFDARLLQEPLSVLPCREPLVFAPTSTVSEAMRAMQNEHCGGIVVTEDGTTGTRLLGIFTERDVLLRVINRGRNPATLALEEVMTRDPECLPVEANVAWVLNKMSVGGFRHVPVVDEQGRPVVLIAVRNVVEFLVEMFPRHVLTLPPAYGAEGTRTREGA